MSISSTLPNSMRSIGVALLMLLLVSVGTLYAPQPAAQTAASSPPTRAIIRYEAIDHPVVAKAGEQGMVVSQRQIASQVGADILSRGGNAVDAAIATGFALAVVLPRAGNLGGSGFMLIYLKDSDQTIALDFRSMAPLSYDPENYLDSNGERDRRAMTFGARAMGVPGTVAGLYKAWQDHGSLPWKTLLQPAYKLARKGIVMSPDLAYVLEQAQGVMSQYPGSLEYYKPDGSTYQVGEVMKLPDLAWSIKQIMQQGAYAFYKGAIAEKIDDYMQKVGGTLTAADLAGYRVGERTPLVGEYRNHKVITMPPVSAGGLTLLQMLNVLEHFPVSDAPAGSAQNLHLLAEVMKRAAANRRVNLGDPDFVEVPQKVILGDAIARDMAASISSTTAALVEDIEPYDIPAYSNRDTTHYSIVDRHGNAVSTTYTLGYSFGSAFAVPGTGILLDNQIRNFTYGRGEDHANAVRPGKRMLSTMTPTLVFDSDGDLLLVTGTPGGGRIINIILQVILNVVDHGMNIAEATQAPRIHQQWRNQELGVEKTVNADTVAILRSMGHEIDVQQTMGSTQSIMVQDGKLLGAADTRRPEAGVAIAP